MLPLITFNRTRQPLALQCGMNSVNLCALIAVYDRVRLILDKLHFFSLLLTLQLLDGEVGAQRLGAGRVWISKVLVIDTEAVGGVTNAVALLVKLILAISIGKSFNNLRSCRRQGSWRPSCRGYGRECRTGR
jgi:hypothetical protein